MPLSLWQILFSILSLLFCIKGLGGSFNALFTYLGIDFYHGPIIGAAVGISLSGFFLTYKTCEKGEIQFDKTQKKLLQALFFIPFTLAIVQRIFLIQSTPLDINRADMLFAIQVEIQAFLTGNNPYGPVIMANGSEVLHGYPPMLWLSYLPLYLLNWDLRYLNVFAQAFFYLFLLDLFLRKKTYWFKNPYANIALFIGLFLIHLFSKQATRQPIDVHTGPYWLYWTLFLYLLSHNRLKQSFWFVPLLLLCREPAVLLLLPFAILIFYQRRKLFMDALWKSLLLGSMIAGPFIFWDYSLYFKGIKYYSQHIYENPLEVLIRFYGFSGILKLTNTLFLQKIFQCTGILISLFVLTKKKLNLTVSESLALGGLSYLWLMLFVSLSYPFIFTELIILFYALLLWPHEEKAASLSL